LDTASGADGIKQLALRTAITTATAVATTATALGLARLTAWLAFFGLLESFFSEEALLFIGEWKLCATGYTEELFVRHGLTSLFLQGDNDKYEFFGIE
jgi:hypothetical protein